MKKYQVTWIDTAQTRVIDTREANKIFGKEEFKEMLQFGAPHVVGVEIYDDGPEALEDGGIPNDQDAPWRYEY